MILLDASALFAYFYDEPGSKTVSGVIDGPTFMSCVNVAEVVAKLATKGIPAVGTAEKIKATNITLLPFGEDELAGLTALSFPIDAGMSLGDKVCLATAHAHKSLVYTADKAWCDLGLPINIRLIR